MQRVAGAETWKGTVEPGKVADLCVVDRDPLAIPPDELPELAVRLTVVGGRIVFDAARPTAGTAHRA